MPERSEPAKGGSFCARLMSYFSKNCSAEKSKLNRPTPTSGPMPLAQPASQVKADKDDLLGRIGRYFTQKNVSAKKNVTWKLPAHSHVPPAYVPPSYVPAGYVPPGYVPPGYVPPGYVPPGYVPTPPVPKTPAAQHYSEADRHVTANSNSQRNSSKHQPAVKQNQARDWLPGETANPVNEATTKTSTSAGSRIRIDMSHLRLFAGSLFKEKQVKIALKRGGSSEKKSERERAGETVFRSSVPSHGSNVAQAQASRNSDKRKYLPQSRDQPDSKRMKANVLTRSEPTKSGNIGDAGPKLTIFGGKKVEGSNTKQPVLIAMGELLKKLAVRTRNGLAGSNDVMKSGSEKTVKQGPTDIKRAMGSLFKKVRIANFDGLAKLGAKSNIQIGQKKAGMASASRTTARTCDWRTLPEKPGLGNSASRPYLARTSSPIRLSEDDYTTQDSNTLFGSDEDEPSEASEFEESVYGDDDVGCVKAKCRRGQAQCLSLNDTETDDQRTLEYGYEYDTSEQYSEDDESGVEDETFDEDSLLADCDETDENVQLTKNERQEVKYPASGRDEKEPLFKEEDETLGNPAEADSTLDYNSEGYIYGDYYVTKEGIMINRYEAGITLNDYALFDEDETLADSPEVEATPDCSCEGYIYGDYYVTKDGIMINRYEAGRSLYDYALFDEDETLADQTEDELLLNYSTNDCNTYDDSQMSEEATSGLREWSDECSSCCDADDTMERPSCIPSCYGTDSFQSEGDSLLGCTQDNEWDCSSIDDGIDGSLDDGSYDTSDVMEPSYGTEPDGQIFMSYEEYAGNQCQAVPHTESRGTVTDEPEFERYGREYYGNRCEGMENKQDLERAERRAASRGKRPASLRTRNGR